MSRTRKFGPRDVAHADLLALLEYHADTGVFTWKVNRGGSAVIGATAGVLTGQGYVRISLFGRSYLAHRLAWLYVHGAWPENEIDHINGKGTDNRIDNLRPCDHFQNQQNVAVRSHNTSGHPGVTLTAYGTWKARIVVNGKKVNLGTFSNIEEAAAAYMAAKTKLHTFNPIIRASSGGSDGQK